MSNNVIEIENLTKDYGNGRGIFNENLTIKQGEMVGFVGTNGSGKTTQIRRVCSRRNSVPRSADRYSVSEMSGGVLRA